MPKKVEGTPAAKAGVKKSVAKAASPENKVAPEEAVESAPVKPVEEKKIAVKVKEPLDLHSYVTVRSGFNGKLIYKSKRTGERLVWDEFGSEQDMELQELRAAKNSSRAFFENNWFMIDDPEVIAFLGVERYYKNALNCEEFDSLFEESPEEIEKRIASLPSGQKTSLVYRAKQKIADGEVDSMRVINALEKSLGVELIER